MNTFNASIEPLSPGLTIKCRFRDADQNLVGSLSAALTETVLDANSSRYSGALPVPDGAVIVEYYDETATEMFLSSDDIAAVTAVADSLDILGKTKALVKDASARLQDTDWDAVILSALKRYSTHNPDLVTEDLQGTGEHDLDLPSGWVSGFSGIREIEYPIGEVPATIMDSEDYCFYQSPDGIKLRLIADVPQASEQVRVSYTAPRTVSTIPQNDVDAFAALGASIALDMLANMYLDTSDPTIQADVVNYRTKSAEADARAKKMMKFYKDHMNITEDTDTPPAIVVRSQTLDYPGGRDRITHPRRTRNQR